MNRQEIALLDEAFALPETTRWTSFGEGHVHETWKGELEDEEPVVLRRYNPLRSSTEIQSELKCLDILRSHVPFAVPQALYGVNQETVTEVERAFYTLFEYIPGVNPSLDKPETSTLAGRTLAEMHISLWNKREDLQFAEAERPGYAMSSMVSASEMLEGLKALSAFSQLDAEYLSGAYWERVEVKLVEALKTLSELDDAKHLIHGDFSPASLLVTEGDEKLVAVLDWDDCRWDAPIYDVVGAYPFLNEFDPALGVAFASAYFSGLENSSHPLAGRRADMEKWVQPVAFIQTYQELALMVRNRLDDADYLSDLLEQLG